jgi:hypothetical protein
MDSPWADWQSLDPAAYQSEECSASHSQLARAAPWPGSTPSSPVGAPSCSATRNRPSLPAARSTPSVPPPRRRTRARTPSRPRHTSNPETSAATASSPPRAQGRPDCRPRTQQPGHRPPASSSAAQPVTSHIGHILTEPPWVCWRLPRPLTFSPGARTFLNQRRPKGDTYCRPELSLNRFVGIVHGCLTHHTRGLMVGEL